MPLVFVPNRLKCHRDGEIGSLLSLACFCFLVQPNNKTTPMLELQVWTYHIIAFCALFVRRAKRKCAPKDPEHDKATRMMGQVHLFYL